jgi:superfamily II DNA or RNA helicase
MFGTETELLGKNQDVALHSLLYRLPRASMMEFGKTCSLVYHATKTVHQKKVLETFSKFLYAHTPKVDGQLRMGLVRSYNATTDEENIFFPHQVKGAIDVVKTDIDLEWDDRDVTKFLFWEMGTGKTIAGISIMSAVHAFTPPEIPYMAVIVVPLAVMTIWKDTILAWMYLHEWEVLATQKEHEITEASLADVKVVIVTPDLVLTAFKSFMWRNPRHTRIPTSHGAPRYVAGYERLQEPTAKYAKRGMVGAPPTHPLFLLEPTVLIVDECQLFTNPSSIRCFAMHKLARVSKYTIGCSGTPFQNSPNEASGLCRTLAVKDTSLWLKQTWMKSGCKSAIRYSTVQYLHSRYVSRVTAEVLDLPPKTTVRINFDPFVAEGEDVSIFDPSLAATMPNHSTLMRQLCLHTFSKAVREARSVCFHNRSGAQRQKLMGKLIRAVSTMEQGYVDRTLCVRGAAMYGKEHPDEPTDADLSTRSPSQQIVLLHRVIRHRQKAGRRKIVIFTTQTQMVAIAANYLRHAGGCGLIMEYTGKSSLRTRNAMVKAFLSPAAPKAVMFITKAGGVGVTLCPGCETFIIFGSYPWSNEEVRQAAARVHRIGQTQPVEEIMLVPKRSTTEAKIDQIYKDKDERLVKLLRDGDNSGFDAAGEGVWRLYAGVGRSITGLDTDGNHVHTDPPPEKDPHSAARSAYKLAVRTAERRNEQIPACPPELLPPVAVPVTELQLPPVSFPVEGFVEEDDETMYDDLYFEPPRKGNDDMDVDTTTEASTSAVTTEQSSAYANAWRCDSDSDSDRD